MTASDPFALLGRHDCATWEGDTVRRLQLFARDRERLAQLTPLWSEPSLQGLSELAVTFRSRGGLAAIADLADVVPRSVRSLALGRLDETYVEDMQGANLLEIVPPLVSALPQLESLALHGPLMLVNIERIDALIAGEIRTLSHPNLETLSLGAHAGEHETALLSLAPAALPALRRLDMVSSFPQVESFAPICATLAAAGWLAQLTQLSLCGVLSEVAVAALANGLGDRKLARLAITTTPASRALRERLAMLCDQLVCPEPITPVRRRDEWFEHANKPEWGRGRLVRRFDDKVEIEFPEIGAKVFKADAPFLRAVS